MKKIFIIAAGALLLASCQQNKNTAEPDNGFVQISPIITKATDTNFEEGDKVGVSINLGSEVYAKNQELTFTDGVFKGTLKWYSEALSTSTLTAYYPYSQSSVPTSFEVAADQSAGVSASDLIAGIKEDVTPSTEAIVVPFKHLLSKIVLKIDNQSGAQLSAVELDGSKRTATVDLTALSATVSENAETSTIKACAVKESEEYALITVPQSVAFNLTVTLSTGDKLSQKLSSVELVSGGQYTINAKVLPSDITVSISGDIEDWTDKGEIAPDQPTYIDFAEYDGYFVYKNEKYTTKTFSDGTTWMTQPMRYIPDGYTVSTDPASTEAHIWAPYTLVSGVATPSTDEELVAKNGYLYDYTAIFGEEITKDNASSFEGKQGICPNGWHVPTRTEYINLCGYSNKAEGEDGPVTKEDALLWDSTAGYGSVKKANELGWNFVFSGVRMKLNYTAAGQYQKTEITEDKTSDTSLVGNPALSYYASSTLYKYSENKTTTSLQFFALMSTYTPTYKDGRLSLAFAHYESGVQLRCIKDTK